LKARYRSRLSSWRSQATVTYRELEARSNQLAHLLRAVGLKRFDHDSIFMENHARYVEYCAAHRDPL
jgi:long-chain acyl-CoA synthetase